MFERFAARFDYVAGDLRDPRPTGDSWTSRASRASERCSNIVFYLAIKPADFAG